MGGIAGEKVNRQGKTHPDGTSGELPYLVPTERTISDELNNLTECSFR